MEIWLFILALLLAYAVPGPDMVLLLQSCGGGALRPAVSAALGLALARALHVTLAGVGLAALLRTSEHALAVIQLIGGLYLGWLGWSLCRSTTSLGATDAICSPLVGAWRRSFLRGLATNLSNPKALLFCSMLLPQFIAPAQGTYAGQFLLLGTVLVAVGLACDSVIIGAGRHLMKLAKRHPRAETALHRGFGILFLGFALRLILT